MDEVFFCSPVVSSALSMSLDLSLSVCVQTGRHFLDPLGLWPFFSSVVRHFLKGSGSQAQSVLSVESARQS